MVPAARLHRRECDLARGSGSHKLTSNVATPSEPPFFSSFEDELVEKYLVPIEVSWSRDHLDDSLVHWSPRTEAMCRRRTDRNGAGRIRTVLYHLDQRDAVERWELFEVDFDFFVDESIAQVVGRPSGLWSLGHRPYRNWQLTEAEFADLLAHGPEIRAHVYKTSEWPGLDG